MNSKEFNLEGFLKEAETTRCTCSFCRNAKLAAVLEEFMVKKSRGETSLSLNYLFEHCLVPTLGAPKNKAALYTHVQVCMGRNVKTGKLNAS